MRWVPLLGALGGGTGAIAIGTAETSTSTTTITLIRTTISIATSTGVRAGKVIGSTIRSTAEMRRMATEEPQTSSVVRVPAEPEIAAVQVIGQVELVAPAVPVVLGLAPAEARELEIVQVVAVPVRDPVALLPKTKSVTAAHHRDLVAVPRVADLAAVAETMREPVAVEAAKAWAAAV